MNFGVIRKISQDDLDEIIKLEQKCFNSYIAYTPKQLKYLIIKANSNCLAESFEEILRGFIIILYKQKSQIAGIETLNVDPRFQGNGIGKKLLKAAEEDMHKKCIKKIRLEVSTSNTIALKLYEKSGFRKIALIKNYYNYEHFGTQDAFRMVKELTT